MRRKLPTKMLAILALVLMAALSPSLVHATIWTMTDLNSTALIDDASSAGMYTWTVEGQNFLYQQWFWYRVGSDPATPESSIDTLTLTSATQAAPNKLTLLYTSAGLFNLTIEYTLLGGQAGSGASDMAESIRVSNLSGAPLDFHFFQYTDFDFSPLPGADTVQLVNENKVKQTSPGGFVVSETTAVPDADRFELALWNATLAKLNDGDLDNLSNANVGPYPYSAGPGDVTWALQWDEVLSSTGTLLISKNKHLTVPIPPSVLLLGSGLLGLALLGRRRGLK